MNESQEVSLAKKARTALPWEKGFAGMVLNPRGFVSGLLGQSYMNPRWDPSFVREASRNNDPVQPIITKQVVSRIQADSSGPAYQKVGLRSEPLHWATKVAEERQVALGRWHLIVAENPAGSKLGQQIQEISQFPEPAERIQSLVDDTFAGKSTRTLEQRSGSLLMYSRWRSALPLFKGILPFVEQDAYSYL